MNIKPLKDRVLLQRIKEAPEKIGNLYVPDTAKEKPQAGIVIAVGTNEEVRELIHVGDKVVFTKYSGTEIKSGTEKYLIVSADDILAILE